MFTQEFCPIYIDMKLGESSYAVPLELSGFTLKEQNAPQDEQNEFKEYFFNFSKELISEINFATMISFHSALSFVGGAFLGNLAISGYVGYALLYEAYGYYNDDYEKEDFQHIFSVPDLTLENLMTTRSAMLIIKNIQNPILLAKMTTALAKMTTATSAIHIGLEASKYFLQQEGTQDDIEFSKDLDICDKEEILLFFENSNKVCDKEEYPDYIDLIKNFVPEFNSGDLINGGYFIYAAYCDLKN